MENKLFVNFENKQLSLLYNGQNLLRLMSNQDKASYLETANTQLEADLNAVVDGISTLQHGHLLWIVTWTPLRLDDLEGLIAWYYTFNIIRGLCRDRVIQSIQLSHHFPRYFRAFLSRMLRVRVKHMNNPLLFMRKRLRESLTPLKMLYKIKQHRGDGVTLSKGDIWLSTVVDFRLNRYRSLLGFLRTHSKAYFHNYHVINVNNRAGADKCLNFAPFFRTKDLLIAVRRALYLKLKSKQIKHPGLVSEFIKAMRLSQLTVMVVRERMIERAMMLYPPKAIFLATAMTYPPARLISRLAYLHSIPTIIVACRPMFTRMRPEERVCKADLVPHHNAHIANYFLVWDKFSQATLLDQGIANGRVFIHQSHRFIKKSKPLELHSVFLVIFMDFALNEKLISVLEKLREVAQFNIAIRTHPAIPLTSSQLQRIKWLFPDYKDSTSYKLHDINYSDVIALTISSSAVVEACSYGCGVIWLPYLNERAIIFYAVMQLLGWSYSTEQDFFRDVMHRLNKVAGRQAFIQDCQTAYQQHFVARDTLASLLAVLQVKN